MTVWLAGGESGAHECYEELRVLTSQSGDRLSLAAGMAGQAISTATNHGRPRDAAVIASELVDLIDDINGVEDVKIELLFAAVWVQFSASRFDAALRNAERLQAMAGDVTSMATALATALTGVMQCLMGKAGADRLAAGVRAARAVDPVTYAQALSYKVSVARSGLLPMDDELLDETRDGLQLAESFGDIFGLSAARFAHATALIESDTRWHGRATELFEQAHSSITRHKDLMIALPLIETHLAVGAAQHGQRGGAI